MRLIVKARERAADNDFAIGLQGDGGDGAVSAAAKVDGRIDLPVRVEAGDATASDAAETSEVAANKNLAVELERDGIDRIVGAESGVLEEVRVERAIGIEASQVIASGVINVGERAANQDPAIRLNGDGAHGRIRTRAGVEGGVE